MTRYIYINLLIIGLSIFSWGCSPSTPSPPNILWIIADDLSLELGCYGDALVKTPYLDGLAAEGVMYRNAFSTAPVCSASRSAFNTGMYQTSIGAHQHRTHFKEGLPEGIKILSHYLQEAGYFTSNGSGNKTDKKGKTDFNFLVDNPFDGGDWSQREQGQPFFAQIQIFDPHRPFVGDPENPIDPAKVQLPPFYPDHALTRKDWALYLESIQVLDKKVGGIVNRLGKQGLAYNTIVFFFGDHGRPTFEINNSFTRGA